MRPLEEVKISLDMLRANPNFPWDWKEISTQEDNRCIEFIDEFKDKPLNWETLSWTMDFFDLITRPTYPWDWSRASYGIGQHRLLSAYNDPEIREFIDWHGVSRSEHIGEKFIIAHPELPWDPDSLLDNANLSLEYYATMPNKPDDMVEYLWENHYSIFDLDDNAKREWNDFVFRVTGEHQFMISVPDETML